MIFLAPVVSLCGEENDLHHNAEGGRQAETGEGRGRNGEGSEGGWKKRWRKVRGRVEGREGRSDGYKDGGVNANHCCHQRKNFLRLVSISFLCKNKQTKE